MDAHGLHGYEHNPVGLVSSETRRQISGAIARYDERLENQKQREMMREIFSGLFTKSLVHFSLIGVASENA